MNTFQRVRDYGGVILAAILVALFVRGFVLEAYRVPSPAMRPTLEPGDTIFVSKFAYGWGASSELPARGDVVVFRSDGQAKGARRIVRDFVKRVVGLPGDRVGLKGGRVILNGNSLEVSPPPTGQICGAETVDSRNYDVCWDPPVLDDAPEEVVPPGSIFVIGDLRSQTVADPQFRVGWGVVPATTLRAKVLWIWLSIEPPGMGRSSGWFSRLRFDRMFRRIR